MKNKYSRADDVSDVTGCRASDKLLLVGGTSMNFMKKYVDEITVVNTLEELDSEFIRHKVFDKIFVYSDNFALNEKSVARILDASVGTVAFFIDIDESRTSLKEYLDTNWYPSDSWDLISNVGKCLITEARGLKSPLARRKKNEFVN